jgi:hypothetical protein
MPFDGFDPGVENPVRVLELIEERLQGGRMWARGCTLAADGRVCLLGAHYSVARRFDDNGVAGRALRYLAQAIEPQARCRRTRRRRSITLSLTTTVRAMTTSSGCCTKHKSWPAATLRRWRR